MSDHQEALGYLGSEGRDNLAASQIFVRRHDLTPDDEERLTFGSSLARIQISLPTGCEVVTGSSTYHSCSGSSRDKAIDVR